jgi:hypothetical protein
LTHKTIQSRILPVVAVSLAALLLLWLALTPAEAQLGGIIKLVFVHGALVWVGLATFSVAGALGVLALVLRRDAWYYGTASAGLAALILWFAYAVSSMVVTGMTWGQIIAWNEPRVRATGLILIAALVLYFVARLVDNRDFTAVVNVLLGIVPWIVVRQAEVIRHPVDPIGGSGSTSMQTYYMLIVLTVGGLAVTLVAWLWLSRIPRAERSQEIRGE